MGEHRASKNRPWAPSKKKATKKVHFWNKEKCMKDVRGDAHGISDHKEKKEKQQKPKRTASLQLSSLEKKKTDETSREREGGYVPEGKKQSEFRHGP